MPASVSQVAMEHTDESRHCIMRGNRHLVLMSSSFGMTASLRALMPNIAKKRMAFIPTASYAERYGRISRIVQWWWRSLGVDVHTVHLTDPHRAHMQEELNRADMFYVCGGNSFYLMHCLETSGAAEIIRKRVAQGVPYIGESAGAVVASPDVNYIAPMDAWNKEDLRKPIRGMYLDDLHVVPHKHGVMLGRASHRILQQHEHDASYIGLRNDQAVIITGEQAHVVTNHAILPLIL